jgi:hypothetical protein
VEAVTSELQARVRERIRLDLLRHGASDALSDPQLFADVDALVRAAVQRSRPPALLLPELLGDPATWRLEIPMRYGSHRASGPASAILFVKRRVLMPLFRWLFEYSRDNFERQQRVNDVLFACVQELAIDNARLRREVERLAAK